MNFRRSIKDLFTGGEKGLFDKMESYISLAKSGAGNLKEMLDCNSSGWKEKKDDLGRIEKDGDSLTFSLKDDITKGSISPSLIDSFTEVVDRSDDILDTEYYIAREVARFRQFSKNLDNEELKTICIFYTSLSRATILHSESLTDLQKIFHENNFQQVIKFWADIQKLEEEVDEIKDGLLDQLYEDSAKLSYLSFIHLSSLIHKIDDLLDQSQDIADVVIQIITAVTG